VDFSPVSISLKTTLAATSLALVFGLAAARWSLKASPAWVRVLNAVIILPIALPPTVIGLGLLLLLGRHGWIGSPLWQVGLSVVFTWPATVITATVVAFPFVYMTARGAFLQIDAELYDAARVMGASETSMFYHITLPLAWPGILSGMLLGFGRALGEFGATLMLAGNIPGKTQTLPLAIYFAMEAGDQTAAILYACLSALICLGVVAVQTVGAATLVIKPVCAFSNY